MKQNLSLVILALLGLVALCVAQGSTTPMPETAETTQAATSANPNPTVNTQTAATEATTPSGNTGQTEITPTAENTVQTEITSTAENTVQTEITPTADNTTAPANSTQTPPVKPTEGVGDPGLSDGAIAGIAIGSIAGVAAIGGGVFGILKKTGRI